ncbi:MAG: hypothetical protein D6711_02905 [Chloroflexi bacterium]|nr:MAG: hypothetical protein D6711_02905 [Chloroflexota bacterium]
MIALKRIIQCVLLSLLVIVGTACGGNNDQAEDQTAPQFTLPSANTAPVSLSDYIGKPVLLYFHMAVG